PLEGGGLGGGMPSEAAPGASLIRLEEEARRFWKRHDVPAAARDVGRGGPPLTAYAQPLAVDQARADQVRLLATADLLARYQAMRGAAARLCVGWAGHGLPVEVAVERALAAIGAEPDEAAFNRACRAQALAAAAEGEVLADHLGLWLEEGDAYLTLAPEAVGITWAALHRLWLAGRLRHERRVVPFCPRCATALSAAEAARSAAETETLAAWLLLPWEQEPGAYLLVWTPDPWTLVGMVALAVHPEATYVLVAPAAQTGKAPRHLLLAEAAFRRRPGALARSEYRVVRRLPGKALRGAAYRPPFTFVPAGERAGGIVLSDDVPLGRGTGLMPVAPSFDARSLALAASHELPVPTLLDDWGRFDEGVSPWRGLSPLDVDPLVVENLRSRGLLLGVERSPAPRSLCPHCRTPLLPLARRVWLADTGSGPWILGRDRAWGAPLPIWICGECGEATCLAGLDDLAHRLGLEVGQIDPHRPAIDRLALSCEACGGAMRRVPQVVDADFEAAVVPWALGPATEPDASSLAVGLGDRHLGWLGDSAEVAALLRNSLAWEQAVALGEAGERPAWTPERGQPADAARWAAYTGGTPEQAEASFLRPVWHLAARPAVPPPAAAPGGADVAGEILDRWLRARLFAAAGAVGQALEAADPGRAAGALAALVDDLMDWYLPQHPGGGLPGDEAVGFLARLLAPFVPHLAESVYRRRAAGPLGSPGAEDSVHLAGWPAPPAEWQDEALLARVALVRRLAALAQEASAAAGLEADRLLPRALVGLEEEAVAGWPESGALHDLLAQALVVSEVQVVALAAAPVSWRLLLAPDRAPARDVPPAVIDQALAALDPGRAAALAADLRAGLSIGLDVSSAGGGQAVTLLPDEVRVTPRPPAGWTAAGGGDVLVSLELSRS
ncbi:MAG: class I tRNA ligase family protein, partial [Anaerolineae bacterium]